MIAMKVNPAGYNAPLLIKLPSVSAWNFSASSGGSTRVKGSSSRAIILSRRAFTSSADLALKLSASAS